MAINSTVRPLSNHPSTLTTPPLTHSAARPPAHVIICQTSQITMLQQHLWAVQQHLHVNTRRVGTGVLVTIH